METLDAIQPALREFADSTTPSPKQPLSNPEYKVAIEALTAQVPLRPDNAVVRRAARLQPAVTVRPTQIRHIQQCIEWALKHKTSLIVIEPDNGGHFIHPNTVEVDMSAFDKVDVILTDDKVILGALVVAGRNYKTANIVRTVMEAGFAVPWGTIPSTRAANWLQGGFGPLSPMHGLACDAIVGVVMVIVATGQVFCIGKVPIGHQPAGSVLPANETDLLWAMKGASTDFGIVVSVTLKAYTSRGKDCVNVNFALGDGAQAENRLREFNHDIAMSLAHRGSAGGYLYCSAGQLYLMANMYAAIGHLSVDTSEDSNNSTKEHHVKRMNAVEMLEHETDLVELYCGYHSGTTSSFKRCLFLRSLEEDHVAERLVAAMKNRPSPFCHLQLVQGGGAVHNVGPEDTAFGCRYWGFACVITGVWTQSDGGLETSRAAMQWVSEVVEQLLPFSCGAYGADLGPFHVDAALAAKAFGPNGRRLARLKHLMDPHNILAYTPPFPTTFTGQKLVIFVSGRPGAGKNDCADVWSDAFKSHYGNALNTQIVDISDVTMADYADATDADLERLLQDRAYRAQHRQALTAFFQQQMAEQQFLPQENFQKTVQVADNVDVLFITGTTDMTDEAPVATLSHLSPDLKLIEVYVQASQAARQRRRELQGGDHPSGADNSNSSLTPLRHQPDLVFNNEESGVEDAFRFFDKYLSPYCHKDLEQLAQMSRYTGDWKAVNAIVCTEASYVYAYPLSMQRVHTPLVVIREAGEAGNSSSQFLSVVRPAPHISSLASNDRDRKRIELDDGVIHPGKPMVFVDGVLAGGKMLYAVLTLLREAKVAAEDITVMVVAEFPAHGGRKLLYERGFGMVKLQSLLVLEGL